MRRLVMLVPLLLPLASSCGGAAPTPRASSRLAPSTSASDADSARASWVIARPAAVLREQPDDASIGMRSEVDDAKADALRDDDHAYALFLKGEERGDFVSVDTLAAAPRGYGCSEPLPALAPFALTLWVRKSGLAAVTTRRIRTLYDDETAVTLAPGVVLHEAGAGFQARVDSPIVLDVEVPADARGTSFSATRGFDLDAKATGGIYGAFRLAGKEWGAEVLESNRSTYARSSTSRGPVVTLRTQCAQYEVRPNAEPDDELGLGGLGLMGTGRGGAYQCQYAPKGASVYFRSGERAGFTRKPLRLADPIGKDRSCWTVSLAADGGEHEKGGVRSWVEVCLRMKDAVTGNCPED
jgi:hypothetical protein